MARVCGLEWLQIEGDSDSAHPPVFWVHRRTFAPPPIRPETAVRSNLALLVHMHHLYAIRRWSALGIAYGDRKASNTWVDRVLRRCLNFKVSPSLSINGFVDLQPLDQAQSSSSRY